MHKTFSLREDTNRSSTLSFVSPRNSFSEKLLCTQTLWHNALSTFFCNNMDIQILPSYQIDTAKWDACVQSNTNGLIYATSDYLNATADNWSGLIINDYETIMPLPWRNKWGITYLYTPPFTQQLGLIGKSCQMDENMLQALNKFVRYGDYFFNYSNEFTWDKHSVSSKSNYILDLSIGYNHVNQSYSNELKSYLKKTNTFQLQLADASITTAVDAYQMHYQERMPHLKQEDFERMKKLCQLMELDGRAFAKAVVDKAGKQLAIGLFLKDNKRIYNLMPTTFPDGRKQFAMHYLLDNVFKEYAEQQLLFDFEGSDLPGVKRFYEQFGSANQPYTHWHFNHLPWLMRLVKH